MVQTFVFALEGLNGAGKSSVLAALIPLLAQQQQLQLHKFHFPGSTPIGTKLRNILLDEQSNFQTSPIAEFLLFAADFDLTWNLIENLSQNTRSNVVLTDRSYMSSLAFQGSNGVDKNFILNTTRASFRKLPGFTKFYILNTSPTTCKQRLLDRGTPLDRIEKLPQKQQNLVHETFMQYIDEQNLDGVPVLAFDGNLDTQTIAQKIADDITQTINSKTETP